MMNRMQQGLTMEYLKVSSKSSPASVAGAIAGLIKDGKPVVLQSIGAGALNQSIKAVAVARGFLVPEGIDISVAPSFSTVNINESERTALRLSVVVHETAASTGFNIVSGDPN